MKVLDCGQRIFVQWHGKKDASFFRVLIEERDSFGKLTGRIWEDESRNKYQPIRLDGCINESVAYIASSSCNLTGCSHTLGTTRNTPWLNTNVIAGGHSGGAPLYYSPTDIPRSFGGIKQVRGVISIVSSQNGESSPFVKSVYGSSAIRMINFSGDVVTVNPPWFKDMFAEPIPDGGWFVWYFARLPNGFELIERRSDSPNLQRRYVTNDGKNWIEEGSRTLTAGSDSIGYENVEFTLDRELEPNLTQDNNGVAFIYDPSATTYFLENRSLKRFLLHGIPNNTLTLAGYDVKKIRGHFEIRYALKDSTGRITTWNALVQ